jgi:hypothetical protein
MNAMVRRLRLLSLSLKVCKDFAISSSVGVVPGFGAMDVFDMAVVFKIMRKKRVSPSLERRPSQTKLQTTQGGEEELTLFFLESTMSEWSTSSVFCF